MLEVCGGEFALQHGITRTLRGSPFVEGLGALELTCREQQGAIDAHAWYVFLVVDRRQACKSWRKAVAIARIAQDKLDGKLSDGVLWYHADYVAPSWGKRLDRETKIGLHIFYS